MGLPPLQAKPWSGGRIRGLQNRWRAVGGGEKRCGVPAPPPEAMPPLLPSPQAQARGAGPYQYSGQAEAEKREDTRKAANTGSPAQTGGVEQRQAWQSRGQAKGTRGVARGEGVAATDQQTDGWTDGGRRRGMGSGSRGWCGQQREAHRPPSDPRFGHALCRVTQCPAGPQPEPVLGRVAQTPVPRDTPTSSPALLAAGEPPYSDATRGVLHCRPGRIADPMPGHGPGQRAQKRRPAPPPPPHGPGQWRPEVRLFRPRASAPVADPGHRVQRMAQSMPPIGGTLRTVDGRW